MAFFLFKLASIFEITFPLIHSVLYTIRKFGWGELGSDILLTRKSQRYPVDAQQAVTVGDEIEIRYTIIIQLYEYAEFSTSNTQRKTFSL
jgi:hypothetical protein